MSILIRKTNTILIAPWQNLKKIFMTPPAKLPTATTKEHKSALGRKLMPTRSDKTSGRRKELKLPTLRIPTK